MYDLLENVEELEIPVLIKSPLLQDRRVKFEYATFVVVSNTTLHYRSRVLVFAVVSRSQLLL